LVLGLPAKGPSEYVYTRTQYSGLPGLPGLRVPGLPVYQYSCFPVFLFSSFPVYSYQLPVILTEFITSTSLSVTEILRRRVVHNRLIADRPQPKEHAQVHYEVYK
jgi:hypothetical protein